MDDTLEIAQGEISSKHILQVIIDFGNISGLIINMSIRVKNLTVMTTFWLGYFDD